MSQETKNRLYYGDNLDILRHYIPDESVDLVYLDPPFNSNANYNVLFAEKDGSRAASQIRAFDDTWTWDADDEVVYSELVMKGGKVADVLQAFRTFLGPCDMMAYLVMMAPRLVELRRVMKPYGSIYLHCDPTASHYLKLIMDAVFSPVNFVNEIVWKRSDAHNDAKQGASHYGRIHDVILFYAKSHELTFNTMYIPLPEKTVENWYRYIESETGRRYNKADVTGPGGAAKGNPYYEWKGVTRYWRYSKERMALMDAEGRLVYSKTGMPYQKRYLDESKGVSVQDWWDDIPMLRGIQKNGERLGYPTQKPESLLDRIIQGSSNKGDIILDPFCGCGTMIASAQRLDRKWIGIDITHLAIAIMRQRLQDTFGDFVKYEVIGEPTSIPDAQALAESDQYQFQWWALGLVGARPVEQKKGADKGIDGKIVFPSEHPGEFQSVIISVKAGHITPNHVRDLRGVVEREKAAIGVLISMHDPTSPMKTEAATAGLFVSPDWGRFPKIQLLTISELLAGKKISMPPIKPVQVTYKKSTHIPAAKQPEIKRAKRSAMQLVGV